MVKIVSVASHSPREMNRHRPMACNWQQWRPIPEMPEIISPLVWPANFQRFAANGVSIPQYSDVIMSAMACQITGVSIVYLAVYSGADQRKHQSSASLAFVRGIQRWPVNFARKGPVTQKMFPFDDVIMERFPVFVSFIIVFLSSLSVIKQINTHFVVIFMTASGPFY